MILNDVIENWDSLNFQKKRAALKAVTDIIDFSDDDNDDLLFSLISVASDYEGDDYFGTEGLRV